MKIKALVVGGLLAVASLAASADVIYKPGAVYVEAGTGYSFTNVKIGSITISSLSDLTGSVLAAKTVSFTDPFPGTFTLDAVTFSGASVGTLTGDLNPANGSFSYHNVAAGVYDVFASGVLTLNGQFHQAAFLGVDYAVSAVPEPATYGMLLGGMGLVALAVRRKKYNV